MNRTHIVLSVAVLTLASFYVWSKLHKMETTEREYQAARYFSLVEEKDVRTIKVFSKDPEFDYVLTRKGDQWYIGQHLLDVSQTHQLVSSVLELNHERQMFAEPTAKEESEFRLDDPQYRLTVINNDGRELGTVKLGKRTPDYNHFYGQLAEGGEISTVPAYTLGVLEKPPKDLTEEALLPVEVAAVELFEVWFKGEKICGMEKRDDDQFFFQSKERGRADETRVESFLNQLKDLKVGRFLDAEEKPAMGDVRVKYLAKVAYSEYQVVTELMQRVAVKRQLMYGQRYLQKVGETSPEEGTLERFVVEIPTSSKVAQPTVEIFEDRRAAVIEVDNVDSLKLEKAGRTLEASRDAFGKWSLKGSETELPEDLANGVLWALKDLRYEKALTESPGQPKEKGFHLVVKQKSGKDADLRFGLLQNGKPYLWRQTRAFSLSDSSWKTLDEAVTKILKSTQN